MFAVSVRLSVTWLKSAAMHAVYAMFMGSFDAAFAKCLWLLVIIIRLHRMHEMQTILTDVYGVCLSSLCPSVCHAA